MKRITVIFALFLSASFLQARGRWDVLEDRNREVIQKQVLLGNRNVRSMMLPTFFSGIALDAHLEYVLLKCYTVEELEELDRELTEDGRKISYKDFVTFFHHIYDANLKVAIETASSGEMQVPPGIVQCKLNEKLIELMGGNREWSRDRQKIEQKIEQYIKEALGRSLERTDEFDSLTIDWIFLPKDVCNKYSDECPNKKNPYRCF